MSYQPKIVAVGYYHYGTGLTKVMDILLMGLTEDFECHLLALGYSGSPYEKNGVQVYPTNTKGGDVFAAFQAKQFVEELNPDVVFILHDIWMFRNYQQILAPVRKLTKFVAYIPLDGNIVDEGVCAGLHGFDFVGVYTQWAKDQVEGAMQRLQPESEEQDGRPTVGVIGHGVYFHDFHPFPELLKNDYHRVGREAAKRKVFPNLENPDTSFVVLNASCPSPRKCVPVTIEGFALFAEGKPDNVRLCLHQAITEEETRELVAFAEERLGHRLLYNPLTSADGPPLSESDLNLLYNACDVGINTSAGEGWGLVSFEHAATGAAQLIPRHSACQSLWQEENCRFLKSHQSETPYFSPLEMSFITATEVASALDELFRDEVYHTHLSKQALIHAARPGLEWDDVVRQWRSVFNALVE